MLLRMGIRRDEIDVLSEEEAELLMGIQNEVDRLHEERMDNRFKALLKAWGAI